MDERTSSAGDLGVEVTVDLGVAVSVIVWSQQPTRPAASIGSMVRRSSRVQGRPVIKHVVDRTRLAGCRDVVVVTRPEKDDVRRRAQELGTPIVAARPMTVSDSIVASVHRAREATMAYVDVGTPWALEQARSATSDVRGTIR